MFVSVLNEGSNDIQGIYTTVWSVKFSKVTS